MIKYWATRRTYRSGKSISKEILIDGEFLRVGKSGLAIVKAEDGKEDAVWSDKIVSGQEEIDRYSPPDEKPEYVQIALF